MMNVLGLLAIAVLAQGAAGDEPDDVPAQTTSGKAAWDDFPIFLWFVHEGPDPDADALKLLRRHGIDGTNIESPNPSSTHALLGMKFYVGHLAGKGELKLRPTPYQEEVDRFLDAPESHFPVRPFSLSDPATLEKLHDRVTTGVGRHRYSRPMAYSLGDEPSVTHGLSPLDFSFDAMTLQAMRGWLRNQYSGLEELNAVWESDFRNVEDIVPETTDVARLRNAGRLIADTNFASWNDHRTFMDYEFASTVGKLAAQVEELDPGVPVGILGGQASGAFGGYDWYQLTRNGTFFEAYEHGAAPRLVHSFARPQTRFVTTLFLPEDGKKEETISRDLWKRMARGDDGAVIWASNRVFEGDTLELSPAGKELVRTLHELRRVNRSLREAGPPRTEILLYVSQASIRANWMTSSWVDGPTWHKRYTSYENDHGLSIRSREGWARLLAEMGLPWEAIDSRELLRVGGAELPIKVMILNETMALSDAEVHELLRFVAAGGTLICDAHFALFDERLVGRDSQALMSLFGLQRNAKMPFEELARWISGESVQGESSKGYGLRRGEKKLIPVENGAKPRDVGWLNGIGRGQAMYMNLDMSNYDLISVKQPQVAQQMRERLATFLKTTPVRLFPHVDYGEEARAVRLYRFGDPVTTLLIVNDEVPLLSRTISIHLAGQQRVHDVTEGISLGIMKKTSVRVPSDRLKVLRLEQPSKKAPATRPPPKKEDGDKKPNRRRRRGG